MAVSLQIRPADSAPVAAEKLLDLSGFDPHISGNEFRIWPILQTVTPIMFWASFTSITSALIAIFAAKQRRQTLLVMTMVVTPT